MRRFDKLLDSVKNAVPHRVYSTFTDLIGDCDHLLPCLIWIGDFIELANIEKGPF